MTWRVLFHKKALKDLGHLSEKMQSRIKLALRTLKNSITNAREPGLDIKKLKGDWNGFYRLRVGSYRVIFEVNWSRHEIRIYRIVPRKRAYK